MARHPVLSLNVSLFCRIGLCAAVLLTCACQAPTSQSSGIQSKSFYGATWSRDELEWQLSPADLQRLHTAANAISEEGSPPSKTSELWFVLDTETNEAIWAPHIRYLQVILAHRGVDVPVFTLNELLASGPGQELGAPSSRPNHATADAHAVTAGAATCEQGKGVAGVATKDIMIFGEFRGGSWDASSQRLRSLTPWFKAHRVSLVTFVPEDEWQGTALRFGHRVSIRWKELQEQRLLGSNAELLTVDGDLREAPLTGEMQGGTDRAGNNFSPAFAFPFLSFKVPERWTLFLDPAKVESLSWIPGRHHTFFTLAAMDEILEEQKAEAEEDEKADGQGGDARGNGDGNEAQAAKAEARRKLDHFRGTMPQSDVQLLQLFALADTSMPLIMARHLAHDAHVLFRDRGSKLDPDRG